MYDNIGRKIKGLAWISFIVEAIAAIITGFVLIVIDEYLVLYGLLVMFVGPIVAWVSSWLLYGFGELIDKTCDIECNTRGVDRKAEEKAKADSEKINRLEALRSQGLITEEEYQQAISKEQ